MNRSIFCIIFLSGLFINTICCGQDKLMFLVAGQSNAVGKGDAATSDSADQHMAFEYKYKTNSIVPLKDPVGENALTFSVARTGSAWPAFARQLIKYKKQQVIIIPAARDGSSCDARAELKGDGTWAPNGKLFKNSILKTNAALKLTHAGLSGIIWSQGERDANAINAGVLTADEYEQSLRETIARFRAAFTANIPFYIIETGYYKGHPQRGPDLVRKAQEHIVATYPKVYIVYHHANLFTDAEKLPDGIHYNQQSLNKIGAETARKIFKINNPSFNVAGIFTDNMVLQHGIPVAVWGTAFAGLRTTVCINHKVVSAVTGTDQKWMVKLPAMPYGGPYVLTVKNAGQAVNFKNVMIGEVWLASGQSNMNFSIGRPVTEMEKVVANANFPMIREFNVPLRINKTPLNDINGGKWLVCNPVNVPEFSAVAYFFARKLYLKKKVAIGIIHSSWGGTPVEAWVSKAALLTHPDYKDKITQLLNDSTDWAALQAISDSIDFQKDIIIRTAAKGQELGVNQLSYIDTAWQSHDYPIQSGSIHAPSYGLIWFRKTIDLPAEAVGKAFTLDLGKLLESEITYINGVEVGRSRMFDQTVYKVPAGVFKASKNVIAIRLVNQWGSGQIGSPADRPSLESTDGKINISLSGKWFYNTNIEPKLPKGKGYQNTASSLFNAMINPLIPYGIKGFLWYQGEANTSNPALYKTMQPLMFTDWRNRWQEGNIPFLFVQLPNFKGSSWQWMREAQAFSLTYPNTGMAVSIDVGDHYDVHPHNKQPVGERLALQAEHIAYHEPLVYSGPTFDKLIITGNILTIKFKNTGKGLILKNTLQDSGFFIAGDDHVFHPVNTQLSGTSVILSSPLVEKPVAVRYAWAADPDVTLYNKEGLPAAPFRTDDWKP